MKISATIIVFNEKDNISEVCETVSWADEIIVVDSSSTDGTAEIARKHTDKVFNREFRGYKDKHEFADSMTTGDWIFWIDADERVTPELLSSVEALRKKDDTDLPDGFRIARKTWYAGRWIKHSGWYPDYQMRLYRKSASHWDGIAPHQTARVAGNVEILKGELLHYTKRDLSEHHRVIDSYTTLAAEHLVEKGAISGGLKMFSSAIGAFVRTYLLKQGFRDGVQGLMIAIFTAYGAFLKSAKVWELRNSPK